jgi:hypothetical protein
MVPDERVTASGIKIRCPKCRFVFIMKSGDGRNAAPAAARRAAPRAAAPRAASGSVSGAVGRPEAAASGAIGGARKPVRKRAEEAVAEQLSAEEMARLEREQIEEMDDLAQLSEVSGTAEKQEVKAEHLVRQESSGPSVIIDESLFAAAAAYSSQHPAPQAAAAPAARPADAMPAAAIPPAGAPRPAAMPQPMPAAAIPPAGAPRPAAMPQPMPAAEPPADQPLHEAEHDTAIDVDVSLAVTEAAPGIDAASPPETEEVWPVPAPPVVDRPARRPSPFLSYTLSAASALSASELAAMPEYEGLLVEERRALRKGPAAWILTIIGVLGLCGVLALIGYLIYLRLNPPKKQPPPWGALELAGLEHDVVDGKAGQKIIKATLQVTNRAKSGKFKNVHVHAILLDASKAVKCRSSAPCGPRYKDAELPMVEPGTYAEGLKERSRTTPYNVQLNPGQSEQCQVLLFCGEKYVVGSDTVKVEVNQELTERFLE